MTRFLKITSIVAICFLLVGIVLTAGGTLLGGGRLFARKATGEVSGLVKDIDSGLSKFSDRFPHLSINSRGIYISGDTSEGSAGPLRSSEESFDAASIRKLNINAGAGRIRISERDDDAQTISVSASVTGKFDISESNGVLRISLTDQVVSKNNVYFGFNKAENLIEIRLPKGYHTEGADFSLGAGEIDIDSLKTDDAVFTVGAGRLDIDELLSDSVNISVSAGETDINSLQSKATVLNVNMGKIGVGHLSTDDLTATVDMGEIEFRASGKQTDYDYSINCGMGNIEVDDDSYSGMGVSKSISNSAARKMDLSCSMGNIDIDFE
ncbi:MAG: DUF4097 domain-containing protein [Lachnospiraceae bacterium]|nr:DUF4097 domain-containing protein [Lachnospiraceae bacterium]